MGWKASCILINERGPGYLGTMPPHDPGRAVELIAGLGLGRHRSRGMTTFDMGIYPDHLVVGAYDGAAVIGDPRIIDSCLSLGDDRLMGRVLGLFPQAAVLRVGLQSVVNLFSYEYFEGGQAAPGLRRQCRRWSPGGRGRAGCPRSGPTSSGPSSVTASGSSTPRSTGGTEEFDASAFGEELAFEVMGRFFGCRPDRADSGVDPLELPMESFERGEDGRWWWPFTRG